MRLNSKPSRHEIKVKVFESIFRFQTCVRRKLVHSKSDTVISHNLPDDQVPEIVFVFMVFPTQYMNGYNQTKKKAIAEFETVLPVLDSSISADSRKNETLILKMYLFSTKTVSAFLRK